MYKNIYGSCYDCDIYLFNARLQRKCVSTNMDVNLTWFTFTDIWKFYNIFSAVHITYFLIMCARVTSSLDQDGDGQVLF
jgi:hypothetical protein